MFQSYSKLDHYATNLWEQEKYSEIIKVFNENLDIFPENNYDMTWGRALCYASLNNLEKAYSLLEEGANKGYFYPVFPDDSLFNKPPYEGRFKELLKRTEKLKLQKADSTIASYVLESPKSYSKDTPFFISLHGWGENIDMFKYQWKSESIKENFHHLYIQSSQPCTYNGYCWEDFDKTIKDINSILDKVKEIIGFSPEKMFVGGFSQGGQRAIDICLKTDIPIKGIVVLCPGLMEEHLDSEINLLSSKLNHVTIITGEKDGFIEKQKIFVDRLKEAEVEHKFMIIENLGHWFPDNLSNLLDDVANTFLF